MSDDQDVFAADDDWAEPPDLGGFWRRLRVRLRRRRGMVALTLAAVLAVSTAVVVMWPDDTCGDSGSGVREIDGECVGVTDGSYVFHEAFADVQRKITDENKRVMDEPEPAVTIALLDPLTFDRTSAVTVEQIRNEMEGAYTAQYRVNRTMVVGDQRPQVKLVLANWGSHEAHWQPVVEQLEGMVDDPEPLVAVIGLRLSTVETEQAAKRLAQNNIPMVSSIASADQLNYGAIRGFHRASPPNVEYVAALHAYVRNRPALDSAIMVYDANSDVNPDPGTTSGADLFTRSLRDDFSRAFAGLIKYPAQNYVGISGPTATSPGLFTNIVTNICAVQPNVVLYAGRVVDFTSFLDALKNRVCPDFPVTLLAAGADFGSLRLRSKEAELREKKISVVYATETDPQGWIEGAPGTPYHFDAFYDEFRRLGFSPSHLDDGGAISIHDALLIAAKAVRLFASAQPANALPTHADVLNQMLNLSSLNEVPGAAGQLSFSFRWENSGNPSNKPLPVIEIPSAAAVQTAEVYHTK